MKPLYKKWLIVLTLLWGFPFAALLLANGLVFRPQRRSVSYIENELQNKMEQYSKYMISSSSQTRAARNRKILHISEKLKQFVADANSLDNLTFSVSELASNCGVYSFKSKGLDGSLFSKILNYSHLGRMTLAMDFQSSFNELAQLINLLERNKPIVIIDRFSITPSETEDDKHRMSVYLSIYVRQYPEKAAVLTE